MNHRHAPSILLLTLVLSSTACGGTVVSGDPPDRAPTSDAAPAPAPDGRPSIAVAVAGSVVDKTDPTTPLSGRQVVLLDANEQRIALTTDASGAFRAAGVVPPYDALVAGDGADVTPIAYLALSTARPQLGGWSGQAPCTPRATTIEIPLALPACGAADCRYDVSLASGGRPLEGGVTGQAYDPSQPTETATLHASWCGRATASIEASVLAHDAAHSNYAYASSPAMSVADGVATTAAIVTPTAVPTAGATTLTVASVGVPSAWGSPETSIFLVYPNGGVAYLANVATSGLTTNVPDIAAATLTLQALFDATTPGDPYAAAMSVAKGMSLSTSEASLTVNGPPLVTAPLTGEALSTAGTIAWTPVATDEVVDATLSTIGDSGEAVVVGDVLTSGDTIDLARLGVLGIRLPTGTGSLELAGQGKVASLDAMVDADTLATSDGTESSDVRRSVSFVP
jgi:hypothetical protein